MPAATIPTFAYPQTESAAAAEAFGVGGAHFDGVAVLRCTSLASHDSQAVACSFWFRSSVENNNKTLFASDPEDQGNNSFDLSGENMSFLVSKYEGDDIQVGTTVFPEDGDWHHYIGCIETDAPEGEKRYAVYVDDERVNGSPYDSRDAFTATFNGLEFAFGRVYGNRTAVIDIAEFWLGPQNLLDDEGEIPEATRRKFRSATGQPVNLGINGQAPTGFAPAVYFHIPAGAAASEFATNRGTGGPFVLTGELTNADTSPSGGITADIEIPDVGTLTVKQGLITRWTPVEESS